MDNKASTPYLEGFLDDVLASTSEVRTESTDLGVNGPYDVYISGI